jgi:hypothetical protein
MTAPKTIKSLSRRGIIRLCFVSIVLGCATVMHGAEPAATLDKALSRAMDRNAAIVAARAKVASAQAELNSTRVEVARQVVALWGDVEPIEKAVMAAEIQVKRVNELYKAHAVSASDLDAANLALIDAKAKVSRSRSDLRYLTGEFDLPGVTVATGASTSIAPSQGPHGDPKQLLSALRSQIGLVEYSDAPLGDVIEFLADKASVTIVRDQQATFRADMPVTLRLKTTSLSDVFQAIEDQVRGARFVVRDYGIFLTDRDHAIQEGFLPVSEFLRDHADSRDQPAATSKASPSVPVLPSVPKK